MSHYAYDVRPRCSACGKLLAERVTRPWIIGCGRCKTRNSSHGSKVPRDTRIAQDEGVDPPT